MKIFVLAGFIVVGFVVMTLISRYRLRRGGPGPRPGYVLAVVRSSGSGRSLAELRHLFTALLPWARAVPEVADFTEHLRHVS